MTSAHAESEAYSFPHGQNISLCWSVGHKHTHLTDSAETELQNRPGRCIVLEAM